MSFNQIFITIIIIIIIKIATHFLISVRTFFLLTKS